MIGINNPLNIRYSKVNKWKGQNGCNSAKNNPLSKFCNFTHVKFCIRAAAIILMHSYRKRGITSYGKIISTFAPVSENNVGDYTKFVCDSLHVSPFDDCTTLGNYSGILHYMMIFESGKENALPAHFIRDILNEFKIYPYVSK